jgi:propane monooxygenase coupling protein
MSVASRTASNQNIFQKMGDLVFDQTISHQCGITMNDSVEARAIAEFMGQKKDVKITYQPALIRIDGEGKLTFDMDEISEILGKDMTAEMFEVNTSTHYGRMIRIDDKTVTLFGDMDEMRQYIE